LIKLEPIWDDSKMGYYKYMRDAQKKMSKELLRERLISWRKEPVMTRIKKPTKIARARSLGYKAKQGFVMIRISITKGMRKRPKPSRGRKPSKGGSYFSHDKSLQAISEERVQRRYPNLEVLNSYEVGEDGKKKWFEVILLDKNHPAIIKDKDVGWIITQKKRVHRGLTSAGKRSRNLK